MSSVCSVERPSAVFLQTKDAVCRRRQRRMYSTPWGIVEQSRTDSGAPLRRAYTRCAEAYQANEAPRVVAVTGPGQNSRTAIPFRTRPSLRNTQSWFRNEKYRVSHMPYSENSIQLSCNLTLIAEQNPSHGMYGHISRFRCGFIKENMALNSGSCNDKL